MLKEEEKDFIDNLARIVALEAIKKTGKSDYVHLKNYIIHEVSYEDIVLEIFGGPLLLEQKAVRLSKIEDALKSVGTFGGPLIIAQLAAGRKLDNSMRGAIGKMLGGSGGWKGAFAQALAQAVVIGGVHYLIKLIFVGIEKSKSVCRSTCKKVVGKNDPNRALLVKICSRECKIFGYKRKIRELRQQITYCSKTDNPEKCQTNLTKIVGKLNDFLQQEEELLAENKDTLKSRLLAQKAAQ
jgi:hypothetical protein